jgi:SAM-dependent methyltransferase
VPSYAFRNWGITGDELKLRSMSEERYESEWKTGSPRQMQYVSDAIKESGYANFPQMLRDETAKKVSELMPKYEGMVSILDVGAGLSTVKIFDGLDGNDKDRVYLILLEPSEERVENAAKELDKRGLKRDKNYRVIVGKDLEIPKYLGLESQNIVTAVATIHHHAYLDMPFRVIYDVLGKDGHFITADWHNSMWENPHRVYEFLQEFDWSGKDQDMKKFEEAYLIDTEKPQALNDMEERTNEMIKEFWRGWIRVRKCAIEKGEFEPRDDIWLLEGHRPYERYTEEMIRIGFRLDGVHQILSDNKLLMRLTGKK